MLCLSSLTLLMSLFVPCCFMTLFGAALNVHASARDRGGIASIGKVRPVGRSPRGDVVIKVLSDCVSPFGDTP